MFENQKEYLQKQIIQMKKKSKDEFLDFLKDKL